jgi:hypothetical protein
MKDLAVLALLCCLSASVPAQVPGSPPSAADCRAAADSLGRASRVTGAWQLLITCPTEGPAAVSAAISAARMETDTVYLSALVGVASRFQTPAILSASLQLNADKTATLASRIAGLDVLLAEDGSGLTLHTLAVSWHSLLNVPRGGACKLTGVGAGDYVATATMSTDYLTQIAARADSTANDAAEPQVLRDLAACVRGALVLDVPNVLSPSSLTLAYVCGTKYTVQNSGKSWARLTYDVQGTTDEGSFGAAPNATTTFRTTETGTTRIYLSGQLVQSVANTQIPCP